MDCDNDNEMWQRQGEGYCPQTNSNHEISQCLWNGVSQNEEDLSYMFYETTPVKACRDLADHVPDSVNMNKGLQQIRETTSQAKRRRMLQFDDEVLGAPLCNEMSSVFLKSKEREDLLEEALAEMTQWVEGFAEETSASGYEGLDHSSDGWLADCFNDNEMHCGPNDANLSGAPNVQIDISGFYNTPLEYEATLAPEHAKPAKPSRNVVFRGRKSFMQTPTKLASSVAYPFDFVKPCGVHGDVTLKDINQRLRTPPPSKSKQIDEDPSASYPTSAFSGKPVVGKTKIRTEGGKGSITIMRTKG